MRPLGPVSGFINLRKLMLSSWQPKLKGLSKSIISDLQHSISATDTESLHHVRVMWLALLETEMYLFHVHGFGRIHQEHQVLSSDHNDSIVEMATGPWSHPPCPTLCQTVGRKKKKIFVIYNVHYASLCTLKINLCSDRFFGSKKSTLSSGLASTGSAPLELAELALKDFEDPQALGVIQEADPACKLSANFWKVPEFFNQT